MKGMEPHPIEFTDTFHLFAPQVADKHVSELPLYKAVMTEYGINDVKVKQKENLWRGVVIYIMQ